MFQASRQKNAAGVELHPLEDFEGMHKAGKLAAENTGYDYRTRCPPV